MKNTLLLIFVCFSIILSQEVSVSLDSSKKQVSIIIKNFGNDEFDSSQTIKFLTTCTSTYLLHSSFYKKLNESDLRWASLIFWSLTSIGNNIAEVPARLDLLGNEVAVSLKQKNTHAVKFSYRLMYEVLLLCWSPYAQDVIDRYLKLQRLSQQIAKKQNISSDLYSLSFDDNNLEFAVSFDNLILNRNHQKIEMFLRAYYLGIPRSFSQYSEISLIVKKLYPLTSQIVQKKQIPIPIAISDVLYRNFLQYTMWEARVLDVHKIAEIYTPVLISSPNYIDKNGLFSLQKIKLVGDEIAQELQKSFLRRVRVEQMSWNKFETETKGFSSYPTLNMPLQIFSLKNEGWYTNIHFSITKKNLSKIPENYTVYARNKCNVFLRNELGVPLFKRVGDQVVALKNITVKQSGDKWLIELNNTTLYFCSPKKNLYFDLFYNKNNKQHEFIDFLVTRYKISPESILLYKISGRNLSAELIKQTFLNISIRKQQDDDYSVFYWNVRLYPKPVFLPVLSDLGVSGAP
ncbi:hypothetical protein [Candidatus Uabimicrobium sp. HlEnr_7]|uniref:hypothetical protein n=1 Tax=Candidatus Uabimicrobium helgolandensis TaxID=3095367 RepID=UPI003558F1A7